LIITDPNILTEYNSTDIVKIKIFDSSRVVSGPHTSKSEAINSSEMRYRFTEASLLLIVKNKIRLCQPIQMAESKTINNSKDILQQCARYKFSTSAFPTVIDNPETVRSKQVSKTKILDNSKNISIQYILTLSIEFTLSATQHKIRKTQSLRFATDQNVLQYESIKVIITKLSRNYNLSAKTVIISSLLPKRLQSDNYKDVTTRIRQKDRNSTTDIKIQRLDYYRLIDRKNQKD